MTAPSAAEIAAVDGGVNDELVDAAYEDQDPDPFVAQWQDDRDRCAANGDFDRATALHQRVQEMRGLDRRGEDREIG